MKRKVIYLFFLSIGLPINFFSGCGRELIDYAFYYDIIYKNDTNSVIKYYEYIPENIDPYKKILLFEVLPKSEYLLSYRGEGGEKKAPKVEDYKTSFKGFQGVSSNIIEYDGSKCVVYKQGEGSTTENFLKTYQWRKIAERHYEFTYTFTEEEAQKATTCP